MNGTQVPKSQTLGDLSLKRPGNWFRPEAWQPNCQAFWPAAVYQFDAVFTAFTHCYVMRNRLSQWVSDLQLSICLCPTEPVIDAHN